MRTVSLVVEVFIDVEEDGTTYAEALMLRDADKRLLGQGFASLGPADPKAEPADGQIAARALVDLAETLIREAEADEGEDRSPPGHPPGPLGAG
jgi:hypothetical protein